jgi:hypothetical protein
LPPKPVWQFPFPSQQPFGQVAGPHVNPPHVPLSQKPVGGQTAHCWPLKPQAPLSVPGWQMLFWSQQPAGHVSPLQGVGRQLPSSHCVVGSHWLQKVPPTPQSEDWLPGWQAPL